MTSVDFIRSFPARPFSKGDILLHEGELSTKILAIREGFIKVSSLDTAGSEGLLWIASRYDIVPTEGLFGHARPLHFFYTAVTDGSVYVMDKSEFLQRAGEDLDLMTEIARGMSAHYDDLLVRISSMDKTSVRDRLLSTLIYLAERFSAEEVVNLGRLGLPLTHQDLADMIGSTRETVSVELRQLKQDGLIDYERRKLTVDIAACKAALS